MSFGQWSKKYTKQIVLCCFMFRFVLNCVYKKLEKDMANKKVQITLSDEVLVKLENLAKEKGVSKSAMISILITEAK